MEDSERASREGGREGERFVASNKYFFSIIQMSNMHLSYKCGEKFEGDINSLQRFSHSWKRSFALFFCFLRICYRRATGRKRNTEFQERSMWLVAHLWLHWKKTTKKWEWLISRPWACCSGLKFPSYLWRRPPSALQPWWPSPAPRRRLSGFGRTSTCSGRGGGGGSKGVWISTEEKVGSIAWHFIKRGKGKICPLAVPIWRR